MVIWTVWKAKFSKRKAVFFSMNSLFGLKANGPFSAKSWPGAPLEAAQICHLEPRMGHFETNISHFEYKTDHFEAKIGHFEAKPDHFEVKTGHFEAKTDHFETKTGHFEAKTDHFEATLGGLP